MEGRRFFVTLFALLQAVTCFSQLVLKEGIVYLSGTSNVMEIVLVSITNMLSSANLQNGEFWISVAYSTETRRWTCVSNEHRYETTNNGLLEKRSACTIEIQEPKVSLFDVLTLVRLQTSDNIIAAYLCTEKGIDFWKVFTGEEIFSVDTARPLVFKIESITDTTANRSY
jgi:hypothetical protein